MPHRSFDAARRAYHVERDPVTFDLGGERFTVLPDPSLGDVFELMDAPEPIPDNEQQSIRILAKFIRRMLPDEDRLRWDRVLLTIPSTESPVIIELATWITEQISARPTVPPAPSSRGRRNGGRTSKPVPAGTTPSS